MRSFLGLDGFRWLELVAAVLTLMLLADGFAGHYRSGFRVRMQYALFPVGLALAGAAMSLAAIPGSAWIRAAVEATGWLAIALGVVGLAFHHVYGVTKAPGGYRMLLHHVMYGPPQLAPLGLTAAGMLALVSGRGLAGRAPMAEADARPILLAWTAAVLIGLVLQTGFLHFRGGFNNPFMYLIFTAPVAATGLSAWCAWRPDSAALPWLIGSLWTTFVMGFVGLGMHLRGFDRQMGGLYLTVFNWLEGPPAFAPGLLSATAAVGLIAAYLL